MKFRKFLYPLLLFTWISLGPWILPIQANPLQNDYLCMPKIKPNQDDLSFEIHSLPCGTEEQLMRVIPRRGGVLEFYPSEPPPSAEESRDLEAYKNFHGLQR